MIVLIGLGMLGTKVCPLLPESVPLLLVDYDVVSKANVPNQYPRDAIGIAKVEAARTLFAPRAQIVHKHIDLSTVGVLAGATLVIDCTDNLTTRFVLNDYCAREGIPWIHAAMNDEVGTVATFLPNSPCFSCIYNPGTGEVCSAAASVELSKKIAEVVSLEVNKIRKNRAAAHFTRITEKVTATFAVEKRPGCKTCSGQYLFLEKPSKGYYITYCVAAHCLAAKPLKHRHDHGAPKKRLVRGIPLEVYPNGEIHFLAHADEDVLSSIADEVYAGK